MECLGPILHLFCIFAVAVSNPEDRSVTLLSPVSSRTVPSPVNSAPEYSLGRLPAFHSPHCLPACGGQGLWTRIL